MHRFVLVFSFLQIGEKEKKERNETRDTRGALVETRQRLLENFGRYSIVGTRATIRSMRIDVSNNAVSNLESAYSALPGGYIINLLTTYIYI